MCCPAKSQYCALWPPRILPERLVPQTSNCPGFRAILPAFGHKNARRYRRQLRDHNSAFPRQTVLETRRRNCGWGHRRCPPSTTRRRVSERPTTHKQPPPRPTGTTSFPLRPAPFRSRPRPVPIASDRRAAHKKIARASKASSLPQARQRRRINACWRARRAGLPPDLYIPRDGRQRRPALRVLWAAYAFRSNRTWRGALGFGRIGVHAPFGPAAII